MVFHPLLADVAGASIHPDSAAATIRQMLPGVECSTETVERIDIPDGQIEFQIEQGQLERTNYDHLVIDAAEPKAILPDWIILLG